MRFLERKFGMEEPHVPDYLVFMNPETIQGFIDYLGDDVSRGVRLALIKFKQKGYFETYSPVFVQLLAVENELQAYLRGIGAEVFLITTLSLSSNGEVVLGWRRDGELVISDEEGDMRQFFFKADSVAPKHVFVMDEIAKDRVPH